MPTSCTTETDTELVERTLAGDERAARLLVLRHTAAVRRVFAGEVAGEVVDELTQETMLACFRRLATLSRPERFRAWILRIARNKLHDHLRTRIRARGRFVHVDDSYEFPCERSEAMIHALEARDEARALAWALTRLTPRTQALVLDYYWHERPRAQIAATLGIPVGTVGSRLAYARERLGELILAHESGRTNPDEQIDSI